MTRDNYTKKFLPKDIDFSYNFENLVYQAFNIGRFGTEDERIEILKNLLKNPKKFEINLRHVCDRKRPVEHNRRHDEREDDTVRFHRRKDDAR